MSQKKYTMHVISHTHWDREWYQSFQGYRRRLVFQTDAMMDLLEARPAFPAFHLDAQTSVLLDYLQIRPDQRARLAKHIRSGRVVIGPWFTMPDECHLSGESIVRNLQYGCRICREWETKPSPIGWLSDIFSHISQLPQILRGFGYDTAFMHHGTPCAEDEKTEMVWEGADGTETLIIKAHPWFGYQDFLQMRYRTRDELRDWERKKIALATTNILLGLDGNDHEPAKWDTTEVIARMNGLLANTRVVHSAMPQYLAALRKALGKHWQRGRKRFVGELRVPSKTGNWNGLTNGTGSSRLPLKQANDEIEYLLARLAEPMNAWASLHGGEPQRQYFDLAWQYFFLNHPHDSICGCSIDQAHRDMVYRFDQARMLAQDSLDDSMQAVADRINTAPLRDADYIVTVFNAGIAPTDEVTRISFELPTPVVKENAARGLTPVLLDESGRRVTCDVLRVEREVRSQPMTFKERGFTPAISVKRDYPMDRYHVAAADQIPALGYKTWTIAFEGSASFQLANKKDGQAGSSPYLHCARHSLENEFVRLLVRKDGRIDLYDKPTRTWYRGLHFFEDCGDAGEGWNHIYPTRDTVVLSTDANSRGKARVALGHQSPLTASIKVSLSMRVPSDLVVETSDKPQRKATTSRSRKFVTLPIETTFTLDAGSRRVDCRTTISNTARCHRVRAIFPTNRKTNVWFGDNAFDTVRRNIKLRDTTGWNEREREECPIKDFVAACDSRAGLAVLTKGLYEAAVQDNRSRSIALTLFRGFVERLFFENTQDSLLLGELAMEYALLPFTPERGAPPATIYGEIDRYKLALPTYTRPSSGEPVDIVTLPPYSETNPPQPAPSVGTEVITPSPELAAILKARPKLACDLPPTGSLLELGAPLALSTIKTSEDGTAIIVRVWNPDTRPAKSFLRPAFAFSRVSKTDLLEKPVAKLAAHGQTIPLTLRAKEVVTIRLEK